MLTNWIVFSALTLLWWASGL